MSPEPVPLSCTILFPVYGSPLVVSSSNIIWSSVVDVEVYCVRPPLKTDTFDLADPPPVPVFVKLMSSPIS